MQKGHRLAGQVILKRRRNRQHRQAADGPREHGRKLSDPGILGTSAGGAIGRVELRRDHHIDIVQAKRGSDRQAKGKGVGGSGSSIAQSFGHPRGVREHGLRANRFAERDPEVAIALPQEVMDETDTHDPKLARASLAPLWRSFTSPSP